MNRIYQDRIDHKVSPSSDNKRRHNMSVTLKCPKCAHEFETTLARGERGEYGYTKNTIGDEVGELYIKGLSKDEVSMTLFKKDGKLHTGRVNRVFSELNQQPVFAAKRAKYLLSVGKKDPHARKKAKLFTL